MKSGCGARGAPRRPRRSEAEPKGPACGAREPPGAERDALWTLAVRGALFPSALPQRSEAGMDGGIFAPSSPRNFFILPTSAAARFVGGSPALRILAIGRAWRDGWGLGKGQQRRRRACSIQFAV